LIDTPSGGWQVFSNAITGMIDFVFLNFFEKL
jgi:hypothetical protein